MILYLMILGILITSPTVEPSLLSQLLHLLRVDLAIMLGVLASKG
jgi:hypothetical protein